MSSPNHPSLTLSRTEIWKVSRRSLTIDETLIFHDPETFDTEAEVIAFTNGIAYGLDERTPASRAILRSDIEDDLPFIEAIENY